MIHINDIFSLNVLLIACCFILFIIFMDINDNKKIIFFLSNDIWKIKQFKEKIANYM